MRWTARPFVCSLLVQSVYAVASNRFDGHNIHDADQAARLAEWLDEPIITEIPDPGDVGDARSVELWGHTQRDKNFNGRRRRAGSALPPPEWERLKEEAAWTYENETVMDPNETSQFLTNKALSNTGNIAEEYFAKKEQINEQDDGPGPVTETYYDENETMVTQNVASATYIAPPGSEHAGWSYDQGGPIIPKVTDGEKADVANNGGVRERTYPNGHVLQAKFDANYAAAREHSAHRAEVSARARELLDSLRNREGVITTQTDEVQDLRQKYMEERNSTDLGDRKQLRREYDSTRAELVNEQLKFRNKLVEETPTKVEDVHIDMPHLETDCGSLHLNLVNNQTDVRVPNLIPGCSKYEKAFQEHQEKKTKKAEEFRKRTEEREMQILQAQAPV